MDIAVVYRKETIAERISPEKCCEEFLLKNEQLAYEKLIAPLENRMMRSIWRIVRNAEAAEDTFQDALTIIWRKRKRIHKHPKPDV